MSASMLAYLFTMRFGLRARKYDSQISKKRSSKVRTAMVSRAWQVRGVRPLALLRLGCDRGCLTTIPPAHLRSSPAQGDTSAVSAPATTGYCRRHPAGSQRLGGLRTSLRTLGTVATSAFSGLWISGQVVDSQCLDRLGLGPQKKAVIGHVSPCRDGIEHCSL